MKDRAAIEAAPVKDRDARFAYFDDAGRYTPYLATRAGEAMFLVKTEDKHIGRSLYGKQGRGELAVLGRAVAALHGLFGPAAVKDRAFIDVGANIGTTTVPAVLSRGFRSAVAIEPEPENVRVLRLNVLLNGLEDRITVLPVAVSDAVGESELVVNLSRGGKHWIATDPSKLRRKDSEADTQIVKVQTVTLDHLADTGAIDPSATGLVWIDAEAHEGHILAGASSLIGGGTPLVLEWNPVILDRMGDRERLERMVAENYTHFAGMHRDSGKPSYPLQPVDQLPAYAERFLDRSSTKTDILVLRLEPDQAAGLTSLDDAIKSNYTDDDRGRDTGGDGVAAVGQGLRSRLARLRPRRG